MAGRRGWLNRTTFGLSLASLFSDVSHEAATAVLPAFLIGLGAGSAALGWIEGLADALSAVAKVTSGVAVDRLSRRKPLASLGYLVTGAATAAIALARQTWEVALCRAVAWIARGSRSPPRDVLMVEAVSTAERGRAMGMERAGDALGAVIGPLLALVLVGAGHSPRQVMLTSLVPGLLAFACVALLARETTRTDRGRANWRAPLEGFDRPFWSYLVSVFVFGCGDFSKTLLIFYATQHLPGTGGFGGPLTVAVALYTLYNAVSASCAFPLGILADRLGPLLTLLGGYLLGTATMVGFAFLPASGPGLALLFCASGVYVACQEVAERAYAAELLPLPSRGTGFGLLAGVNGVADLVSSVIVGLLWQVLPAAPAVGFLTAAFLQGAGAALLARSRRPAPAVV